MFEDGQCTSSTWTAYTYTAAAVKVYSVPDMPFPAKTGREAILTAALEQAAREGPRSLSLRGLATSLGIAPNAIYRYFENRSQLQAALAGQAARGLHEKLARAAKRKDPQEAIQALARAYLRFAKEQPSLYELMLDDCEPEDSAHEELWAFVLDLVAQVAGAEQAPAAAVSLWAFLHGMVGLEAAGVLGHAKPRSSFQFGLDAWLRAVERR